MSNFPVQEDAFRHQRAETRWFRDGDFNTKCLGLDGLIYLQVHGFIIVIKMSIHSDFWLSRLYFFLS